MREIEQAPAGTLGALGARLYRLQHGGAVAVAAEEWRRIWQVYHARPAPARRVGSRCAMLIVRIY